MRRAAVVVSATLGFAAVFIATVFVGIWQNQDAECDGVCVSKFPTIGMLALLLGLLSALVAGFAANAILDRRSANPS